MELVRRDYMANEGWETFLSYEDTRQVFHLFVRESASHENSILVMCNCVELMQDEYLK